MNLEWETDSQAVVACEGTEGTWFIKEYFEVGRGIMQVGCGR